MFHTSLIAAQRTYSRRSPNLPHNLNLRFEFRFVSLIAPSLPALHGHREDIVGGVSGGHNKRALLKKSYLLLSWFHYLSLNSSSKHPLFTNKAPKVFKLAVLPSKQNVYTLQKAPMAHKSSSQEQFLFKLYNFKFSVTLALTPALTPSSSSQAAYVLKLTKQIFPFFETNLLFLKYYRITYPFKDNLLFNKLI